jgi:hypothetical protein
MLLNVQTFDPDQFAYSPTAIRKALQNQPPPEALENLAHLWQVILVPLSEATPHGLQLNSGYRSPLVNRAVGGAAGSQHLKGQAADITAPGWTPEELFQHVRNSGLPFDQLIQEFDAWVHVSWSPSPRGEVLRATKRAGRTVYSRG